MRKFFILGLIMTAAIGPIWALAHYIEIYSFPFAWALNFLLMLWVVIFIEVMKTNLTFSYFDGKKWENKGKIYEKLGINFFRKFLVWIGWEKLNKKSNPIEKNTKSLMHLHFQTKKSELGHLVISIIVFGFNVFVALKFGILKSLWLLILNIMLNLYPIFLQRFNRPRIERAIKLSKLRQTNAL